jgi:hypothetical protein
LPLLTGLTVSPTSVVGGSPATGTVTLGSAAPATGVSINLGSSLPLAARVPASVTVPGGATSASFTVTTFPADTTTVQLSAALDSAFQSAALGVHPPAPAPALTAVSVNQASVAGGTSTRGTVTLSAVAPSGGVVVSLSSDSSAATVPGSVNVPGGATSATFTITTSAVSASTAVTITGSLGGASRTATLTVTPAPPPAPSAPSLLSPASQATVAQPITFDWTDVASAATYEIQIDDSSGFTAPLTLGQTVSVSTATISGLPAQPLWWRVRGVSAAGVNGAFSASRAFTVQAAGGTGPLPAPSLLAPAADARFLPGQAIPFDWSDVAGAATYTIQIDDSSSFSAPLVLEQTVTASQLGTSALPTQRMWWRVRASDASGSPGNWSGARRFEVKD